MVSLLMLFTRLNLFVLLIDIAGAKTIGVIFNVTWICQRERNREYILTIYMPEN